MPGSPRDPPWQTTADPLKTSREWSRAGARPGARARIGRSPHRYIWPAELDLMAQLAGFELESRHADWSAAPFTADSPSHVSVYRLA